LNKLNGKLKTLNRFHTPFKVQEFLDSLPYSEESRYRSPLSVLQDNKAHCYDGAVFAAAALRILGLRPLIVELLPNDRDDDHIIAIIRQGNRWGAVAKSNFVGLRYREPVYHSLRELVMSYFESYYNIKGERTLIGYTAPLNLDRFSKQDWLVNDTVMDSISDALDDARKYRILGSGMARKLNRMDARSYRAGLIGSRQTGLFKP
jgi:hypothetical protein